LIFDIKNLLIIVNMTLLERYNFFIKTYKGGNKPKWVREYENETMSEVEKTKIAYDNYMKKYKKGNKPKWVIEYENSLKPQVIKKIKKEKINEILDKEIKATEIIPEVTQATEIIPEVTQATEIIPEVTQATEIIPEVTQATEIVPEVTQATEIVPEVTQESSEDSLLNDYNQFKEQTNETDEIQTESFTETTDTQPEQKIQFAPLGEQIIALDRVVILIMRLMLQKKFDFIPQDEVDFLVLLAGKDKDSINILPSGKYVFYAGLGFYYVGMFLENKEKKTKKNQ
jgi:hypothetical protein